MSIAPALTGAAAGGAGVVVVEVVDAGAPFVDVGFCAAAAVRVEDDVGLGLKGSPNRSARFLRASCSGVRSVVLVASVLDCSFVYRLGQRLTLNTYHY